VDVVHAVAHDELAAGLELLDEAGDVAEVVGQIGVRHDDVLAAGGAEAGQVGGAVPAARLVHDAGAGLGCEFGGAVARAVVGDDDLAVEGVGLQRVPCASDALGDRLGLVEARNHDRDQGRARRIVGGHRNGGLQSLGRAHALTAPARGVGSVDARGPRKSRGIGGEG
jgi:hypothetical protein